MALLCILDSMGACLLELMVGLIIGSWFEECCQQEEVCPLMQVRDRATLYLSQLTGLAGGEEAVQQSWDVPAKNLEASLRSYLQNGAQQAFDLVSPNSGTSSSSVQAECMHCSCNCIVQHTRTTSFICTACCTYNKVPCMCTKVKHHHEQKCTMMLMFN